LLGWPLSALGRAPGRPGNDVNRQDQMILGVYISLGVFLLIAARNPRQHRSLILFAGWSTLAHDAVMIVQGIQYHDLGDDLVGYAVIAVIGLTLIALTPAKQAPASAPAAELASQ